jgi:hypothetical protein
LNKIPISVLGFIFFNTKMTNEGIIFVAFAMIGGFVYAYAKIKEKSK